MMWEYLEKHRVSQLRLQNRRLAERHARRAAGELIRPATARDTYTIDASTIRLKGYHALRLVFPEVSHTELIGALAASDHLPVQQRSAVAARGLMADRTLHSAALPRKAQVVPMLNMLRTATSGPVLGIHHVDPSPVEPIKGLHSCLRSQGLEDCIPAADVWVDSQGACDLEEVLENFEDFLVALRLDANINGPLKATLTKAKHSCKCSRSVSAPACVADADPNCLLASQQMVGDARPDVHLVKHGTSLRHQRPEDESLPPGAYEQYKAAQRRLAAFEKRPISIREWTPPKYRQRVDRIVLKARIPTDAELRAQEIARKAAAQAAELDRQEDEDVQLRAEKTHPLDSFDSLRFEFLSQHGGKLKAELGEEVKFVPAALSLPVQDRFLRTVQATGEVPDFGYHGTDCKNFAGIFNQGLRVPGNGGVSVVHGSSHGVGIYTATPGAASLSRGFCDSEDMLVCGVVTHKAPRMPQDRPPRFVGGHRNRHRPAAALNANPKMVGRLRVGRDDRIIREVGGARIIFNESYVAPLFVAKGAGRRRVYIQSKNGASVGVVRLNGPGGNQNTAGSTRAGAGQVVIKESGERVWLPPEAINSWNPRRVKRMYEGRRQDRERRRARAAKAEAQAFGCCE